MVKKVAVSVRNVSFSYERFGNGKLILDNVNLTVPSGVIFGLLGPSGCGKTTLLEAITGRLVLKNNQGEILIYGQKPSTEKSSIPGPGVGYMPQDLALHELLTVKESLSLFAQLNGVPKEDLTTKIQDICSLLELPKPSSIIGNLSGGQKRRVSLAHALIHEPPLLILDEPTVGVDPMLRKKIWSHLVFLANTRNVTIIITTHYIEEAKEAHIIAGMRKGKILVEEKPLTLMRALNCNNLEACFTRICCASEKDESETLQALEETKTKAVGCNSSYTFSLLHSATEFQSPDEIPSHPSLFTKTKLMHHRNMILLKRSRILLLFQLLVPLANVTAMCVCMGNALSDVPVAVINDEGTNGYAQKFVNNLDLNVVSMKSYDFMNGIRSVEYGESVAAIHMGQHFTECFKRRLLEGLIAQNDTIKCGSISAYFDLTNLQIYYSLFGSLIHTYEKFMEALLQSVGISSAFAALPVDFSRPVEGKHGTTFGDYMLPGASIFILFYLAMGVTILKIIQEKNNGLQGRFWVNGVTEINQVFSHSLTSVIVGVCQVVILFLFVFYIYKLPLKGSIIIVAVLGLLQNIAGLALGFITSSIFNRESEAFFTAQGVMPCHLIMSGILWPLEAVPHALRSFSYFLPIVMPIEAVNAIVKKGWGIENTTVQLGLISSVVWIIIFYGIVLLIAKFSK